MLLVFFVSWISTQPRNPSMRPRMDIYPNGIPGCHTPGPPQDQFSGLPHGRVRSPNAHDGANVGLFEPFQDPRPYGTDERSPGANSYENRDYGSQTSTDFSPGEPPRMPRIEYNQGHGPWLSSNYLLGLLQEHDVLQTDEDSGSTGSSFQQQGNHMVATSAPGIGDARHHSNFQAPEIGFNTTGHASRNSQDEQSRTGRRSSVGSRPRLQTSNLEMTQIPSDSRPSGIHMSTNDWVTTGYWNPSFFPSDVPSGDGRSLAMDPRFPEPATTRAHINPNVSEPWHNGQTSYQSVPQYPQHSPFQHQSQGVQDGTIGSLPSTQDPSLMHYGMQSSDNHDFARSPHEPPPGNTKNLSPNWKPTPKVSSNLHCGERSNVSDNEVRQGPPRAMRRSKRKCPSDPPSPTTPPTGTKRRKRKYTPEERAQVGRTRKIGACLDCRKAKRKVCGKSRMSLYRCR